MEDESKTMQCSRHAKTREDARKIARRLRMVGATNVEIKGQLPSWTFCATEAKRKTWIVSATIEVSKFAKFCADEARLEQEKGLR